MPPSPRCPHLRRDVVDVAVGQDALHQHVRVVAGTVGPAAGGGGAAGGGRSGDGAAGTRLQEKCGSARVVGSQGGSQTGAQGRTLTPARSSTQPIPVVPGGGTHPYGSLPDVVTSTCSPWLRAVAKQVRSAAYRSEAAPWPCSTSNAMPARGGRRQRGGRSALGSRGRVIAPEPRAGGAGHAVLAGAWWSANQRKQNGPWREGSFPVLSGAAGASGAGTQGRCPLDSHTMGGRATCAPTREAAEGRRRGGQVVSDGVDRAGGPHAAAAAQAQPRRGAGGQRGQRGAKVLVERRRHVEGGAAGEPDAWAQEGRRRGGGVQGVGVQRRDSLGIRARRTQRRVPQRCRTAAPYRRSRTHVEGRRVGPGATLPLEEVEAVDEGGGCGGGCTQQGGALGAGT